MPSHPSPTPHQLRRHRRFEASPFATLERAFALLTAGPRPLALDTSGIEGLPDRAVPLGELRSRLLHPSTRYPTRDAAIAALVTRARTEGGAWTVGLAGVLLPGLRRALLPLVSACPGKGADLEAEMLTGLLAALAGIPAGRARLAGWLTGRAFDAAKGLLRSELGERARPCHLAASAEPPPPYAHPDFVLLRAAAAGVICAEDAELIGATRLGDVPLADAATELGLSYVAAHQRRLRAESALVAWLRGTFVEKRALPAGYKGVGRPRKGSPVRPEAGIAPQPRPSNTPRR